jgi:glycine betaine/proline transport system permease protein
MTAITAPFAARLESKTARRLLLLIFFVVAALLYVVFQGQGTLPHDEAYPLYATLNELREWIEVNRDSFFLLELIRVGIGGLVAAFEGLLAGLGWPGVIAVAGGLGLIFGGWRLALLGALGFAAIGALGLWESGMATLAQMLAAVLISLLIGIPLGIIAGRSRRFAAAIGPLLDGMQIMPTLAYLGPMTLLFGIGVAPGTIATLIYAIPPAIRITALGIRGVPGATMEAAESLGSTRWQTLSKVQLPLARRTIGIGVNQTIMMALSMVVITALIGAPGLGVDVLRALQSVNVGAAFQAGLAIVILAIVLDRLTERAGEWMDPRFRRAGETKRQRRIVAAVALAIVVVAVLFARTLADPTAFPEAIYVDLRDPVNDVVAWIKSNLFGVTNAIKDAFSYGVLNPIQEILTQAPWLLVLAVVFVSAWYVSRLRAAIIAGVCLLLTVAIGLWEHGMETLASVIVATVLTLILGITFGIVSARNDAFRSTIRPLLDAAQTLPAFVYLIPAVALFSVGRFTAIVAAVIYAVPPVIRLVDAGIRSVSPTVLEAARSAGSTDRQLLWKVQLPLSRRALLLAANQGIVMVLAMVVVGALVGAGALGFDVISGFTQREDFGKGLAAGFVIVLLGIMLDRITQGAGGRPSTGAARAG